ncbi:hypothetical protein DFJ58DRAFT_283807 [Suillus subalutaceus]|uniref:uncharacterized protein n=1 Tax=Suillus subalutaceus TaxID=48586 RepID=UPI001B87C07A|nr:uncharacterized protein DFJ58DRAFT_283807 [Suillus subalutaceus]KAG1859565.1 hypothetical protein DFJ58DRAFT_283807 [Suillus subalutaceus]
MRSSSYAWYTTCSMSNASCIMIMFDLVRVDRKRTTCVVCASLYGYTPVHDDCVDSVCEHWSGRFDRVVCACVVMHQVGLSSTFGFAGQGAQCRTCTDERTNAPMNHVRRIRTNRPRMQRQSGLTLFQMCFDSGTGRCRTRMHDAMINHA